jgi:hypothetical protein
MENQLEFIKRGLLMMGFDVDKRFKSKKVERYLQRWRRVWFIVLLVGLIQIFVFISVDNASELVYVMSICVALIGVQALIKFLLVVASVDRVVKFQVTLFDFYKRNYTEMSVNDSKFFNYALKCSRGLLYVNLFTVNMMFVLRAFNNVIGYFKNVKATQAFIYAVYWPFDPYEFLIPTFLYHWLVGNFFEFPLLFVDQIIIMTVATLAMCFERLGVEVKEVIDEAEEKSFMETKKRLSKCVDKQNELFDFCGELNSLYGFTIFTKVVQASVTICTLGFYAMVGCGLLCVNIWFNFGHFQTSSGSNAMSHRLGMFTGVLQVLILYWIGDKLKENVSVLN